MPRAPRSKFGAIGSASGSLPEGADDGHTGDVVEGFIGDVPVAFERADLALLQGYGLRLSERPRGASPNPASPTGRAGTETTAVRRRRLTSLAAALRDEKVSEVKPERQSAPDAIVSRPEGNGVAKARAKRERTGRPRTTLKLRFAPAEFRILERAAASEGISVEQFARQRIGRTVPVAS